MEFNKLRFGTAGIPLCTNGDTLKGIKTVRNLNLDNMELEFVRSINITKEKAPLVRKAAKDNEIVLTCHCPYFINLNSSDKKKYYASIGYIRNSAIIASLCGGFSVCFHAGYYQKENPEKVYENIKQGIKTIVNEVKEYDNKIWVRPEISGKKSQFGDLKEILKLSQEIEQVMPCVDFSHLFARENGKNNTYEEFKEILIEIEKALGKEALNKMHNHISGIQFTEKGEKNHLILKESKFNYKDLLKALKEFKCKGVIVCESPNIEEDARLLKETYEKI